MNVNTAIFIWGKSISRPIKRCYFEDFETLRGKSRVDWTKGQFQSSLGHSWFFFSRRLSWVRRSKCWRTNFSILLEMSYNFNHNFVKGEKLTRAFEFGQSRGFPVVVQCRSGGARMQVLKFLRGSFNSSFKFTNRKARFRWCKWLRYLWLLTHYTKRLLLNEQLQTSLITY